MKKILNLPAILLLFLAACFMTSCEDDGTGGGSGGGGTVDGQPTVTLNSTSDLTLAPGEEFTVDFSAAINNDILLKAITVYEDGTKVPVSRLKFNGDAAAANPALIIAETDKDGLDWTVSIIAHSTAAQTVQYEVEVTADDNTVQSVFVTVTTAATPPSMTGSEPFNIDGLEQGSKNSFKLSATQGNGALVSIEVRENDMIMDPTRIEWEGATMMSADNPFLLDAAEQDGFEDIRLIVTLPMTEGTFVYKMTLTDEFNLTSEVVYTVTTAPSGTAIDTRNDVLLNSAGPAGTGGLDLDEGLSVGSGVDDGAEIRDNGIDSDMPASSNWLQSISPVGSVQMKYVVASAAGVPETFTFDGVAFKEDLAGLFTANTGEVIDNTKASSVVTVGDTFIVAKEGTYWLIKVTEVNPTADNNEDNYRFDVKY